MGTNVASSGAFRISVRRSEPTAVVLFFAGKEKMLHAARRRTGLGTRVRVVHQVAQLWKVLIFNLYLYVHSYIVQLGRKFSRLYEVLYTCGIAV